MDVYLWGPPLWNLLETLARILNHKYFMCHLMSEQEQSEYRELFMFFVYSLKNVLPCVYCRESYRKFIEEIPPENEQDLLFWVWAIKDKVNKKLSRPCECGFSKVEKRALMWTSFIDPFQLWDLLLLISLNYPKLEKMKEDEEFIMKRVSYYAFFNSLSKLLLYVPTLSTLSIYLDPNIQWNDESVDDRFSFYTTISKLRLQWAIDQRKTDLELESMLFSEAQFVRSLL